MTPQWGWWRRSNLALGLASVWACGVNMALHYWWDALGSVLASALFLCLAFTRWTISWRLEDPDAD